MQSLSLFHLQSLAPLVVVSVVEGLDVEEDAESVLLAGLGALGHGVEPEGPVGVGAVGDRGEVQLGGVPEEKMKLEKN